MNDGNKSGNVKVRRSHSRSIAASSSRKHNVDPCSSKALLDERQSISCASSSAVVENVSKEFLTPRRIIMTDGSRKRTKARHTASITSKLQKLKAEDDTTNPLYAVTIINDGTIHSCEPIPLVATNQHQERAYGTKLEHEDLKTNVGYGTPIPTSHSIKPVEVTTNTLEEMTQDLQIMRTFENGACVFCSANIAAGEGVMLQTCLHTLCSDCLISAIELQTQNVHIKCPITEETGCGGYLLDREIKSLVTPEQYQNFIDRSVRIVKKDMKNIFHCCTIGCKGWCEFDVGCKTFPCPFCKKTNCLECRVAHDGLDCAQYQRLVKSVSESGQSIDKIKELIDKECTNGWNQLCGAAAEWVQNSHGVSDLQTCLQEIASMDILRSTKQFECPICICIIPVGQGVILQNCYHVFCHDCLIGLIHHCDEPEVKCPYQDENYSCVCFLTPREIKALVPQELYDRHLSRSVKVAEGAMANSFHCKTPDCTGWCEIDGEPQEGFFKCNICGKNNCLKCNVIHENISCKNYQKYLVQDKNNAASEAAVNALITSGKGMKCTNCHIVVQKTSGCDWIKCTLCKTELCWATKGPRWGKNGYGDSSGGCKCRIGGKSCTPTCQNCH